MPIRTEPEEKSTTKLADEIKTNIKNTNQDQQPQDNVTEDKLEQKNENNKQE